MALASTVITNARNRMLGFGVEFLPQDTELLAELTQQERLLIDELLRLNRMGSSLPGDANAAVSVAVYQASYAIPAQAWRIRQMAINYTSGPSLVVRSYPSSWRYNTPAVQPALYFQGSNFFPLDGATSLATRTFSWQDANEVEFDYVTEPAALSSGASTLSAPDEAIPYLSAFLAHWMGTRGKVAEATQRDFAEAVSRERSTLFTLWEGEKSAT